MSFFEPQIVRWEEPPTRTRASGRVDWSEVAEALKAKPGKWAILVEYDGKMEAEDRRVKGLASNIRRGLLRAFAPTGSFEAQARLIGETTRLYVRYVGGTTSL